MIRTLSMILVACLSSPLPAGASIDAPKDVSVMPQSTALALGRVLQGQLQPCAKRQRSPGPGAETIQVVVQFELKRDGSLVGPPQVVEHDGLNEANNRYLGDVERAAIATITECQPFRGLPPEWHDGPQGWGHMSVKFKLPG